MAKYKCADTEQFQMMVLNLASLFPPGHATALLLDTVRGLDLREFDENYNNDGAGASAVPPDRMLAVLFWHNLNSGTSMRELSRDLLVRADLMFLSGGLNIHHSTIGKFIKRHDAAIKRIFQKTVFCGVQAGYINYEEVAIDSTVIKASAGKSGIATKDGWEKRLEKTEKGIEEIYENWKADGSDADLEKINKLNRRKAKISEAIGFLEENATRKRVHLADKDADWRGKRGSLQVGYYAQIAVDGHCGMIVHEDVVTGADSRQTVSMVESSDETRLLSGIKTTSRYLLDSGYASESNLEMLKEHDLYMPDAIHASEKYKERRSKKDPHTEPEHVVFSYDSKSNSFRCMAGKNLSFKSMRQGNGVNYRLYERHGCLGCAHADECLLRQKRKTRRRIYVREDLFPNLKEYKQYKMGTINTRISGGRLTKIMREKLETSAGKKAYQRRGPIVERINSVMKYNRNGRQFLRRGLDRVKIEWTLRSSAHNIGILIGFSRNVA